MKRILLVDDEKQVIKALTRVFMESEYEVYTADSGMEGLAVLQENPVDLVISDMRMPEMDGGAFLETVKKQYPEIIRVIISGYVEEELALRMLEKNIAKHYLLKPWDNEALRITIDKLFQTEERLKNPQLCRLVNTMTQLPTIPEHHLRLMRLLKDESDIKIIAKAIEYDQVIAGNLLRLANSCIYGAKTGSLHKAVTFVGTKNVRHIIASTAIFQTLSSSATDESLVVKIWEHAAASHKLLEHLYREHLGKKLPEEIIPAALLHNLGIVFLLNAYGKEYQRVMAQAEIEKTALDLLEQICYGTTHMEAGAYLLQWWDFSYPLIEAALYHHEPFNGQILHQELVCAVHLVSHYAHKLLRLEHSEALDPQVFRVLNINQLEYEKSLESLMEKIAE